MSGHSKWSTIKHKKGALDAKRGKIFTGIIKELTIAARLGGGDPGGNARLRSAIADAKSANMPADNIKRAIQKGTGELPGVTYEEASYEAYGPGGVAILVEVLTDNKMRTTPEIRHMLTKHGGNLGEVNSVSWMFETKGQILVASSSVTEDRLMEVALEAGAEDFQLEDGEYEIRTSAAAFSAVREALEKAGIVPTQASVIKEPGNVVHLEGKKAQQCVKLLEALEEHDDVQHVYANLEIDTADLEAEAS